MAVNMRRVSCSPGPWIAINKDPDASIFKIADLGVVGDAQVILPKLISEIERIKSGKSIR